MGRPTGTVEAPGRRGAPRSPATAAGRRAGAAWWGPVAASAVVVTAALHVHGQLQTATAHVQQVQRAQALVREIDTRASEIKADVFKSALAGAQGGAGGAAADAAAAQEFADDLADVHVRLEELGSVPLGGTASAARERFVATGLVYLGRMRTVMRQVGDDAAAVGARPQQVQRPNDDTDAATRGAVEVLQVEQVRAAAALADAQGRWGAVVGLGALLALVHGLLVARWARRALARRT